MTAEEWAAAEPADAARLARLRALMEERGGGRSGSRLLAEIVSDNLRDLWKYGGRAGVTPSGRKPKRIFIRPGFLTATADHPYGPVLPKLIEGKGLQLRLQLLLMFDAQCRHEVGKTVTIERPIEPDDGESAAWRNLILASTAPQEPSAWNTSQRLRARQIREAFGGLADKHLLQVDRPKGKYRDYSKITMNLETSNVDDQPPYTVPDTGVWISPYFFTSLWLFALTDIELATYLALTAQRTRFPSASSHFLTEQQREDYFRLTRATWRGTETLHRFGLIERQPQKHRNYTSGKVGNIQQRRDTNTLLAVRYKIEDSVLKKPALSEIHRVLVRPNELDKWRRYAPGPVLTGLEDFVMKP